MAVSDQVKMMTAPKFCHIPLLGEEILIFHVSFVQKPIISKKGISKFCETVFAFQSMKIKHLEWRVFKYYYTFFVIPFLALKVFLQRLENIPSVQSLGIIYMDLCFCCCEYSIQLWMLCKECVHCLNLWTHTHPFYPG